MHNNDGGGGFLLFVVAINHGAAEIVCEGDFALNNITCVCDARQ